MIMYQVNMWDADEGFSEEFFGTLKEAKERLGNHHSSGTVDRIEIAAVFPKKELILRLLNRRGYVKSRVDSVMSKEE